jgi:hypothetical protein
LRKQYVKRADVEEVRERCEARRRVFRELQAGWETWRALRAAVRENGEEMNEIDITPEPSAGERGNIGRLAGELAAAFRDRVLRYKHELGLTTEQALAKAEEPCPPERSRQIQDCPPEHVTWDALEELNRRSPELALRRYEEINQAARDLLRTGDLAGATMEGGDSQPWERAKFLAIREDLSADWRPRNGIERRLLDQMALAQAEMFRWHERLTYFDSIAGQEAAEKAAAMLERFHRLFVRSLRALGDLRKVPLAVVVQNVGPVQVGGQQLNVAETNGRNDNGHLPGEGRHRRDGPKALACPADRAALIGECE